MDYVKNEKLSDLFCKHTAAFGLRGNYHFARTAHMV
jgi:hypothetical protein